MAVETLYDVGRRKSVMWCNTDGRAFGPVFDDHDAAGFLDWIADTPGAPEDVRVLSDSALEIWRDAFEQMRDDLASAGPSDVQIYGAGAR